jgi:hypothetical protein
MTPGQDESFREEMRGLGKKTDRPTTDYRPVGSIEKQRIASVSRHSETVLKVVLSVARQGKRSIPKHNEAN